MEDEKFKLALDFFNGDNLAATVWLKKYQYKNEKTPNDSQKRYVKEIAATEYKRIRNENFDGTKIENLSTYGQQRYGWLFRRISNSSAFNQYIDSYLGYQKIILGGSQLQGIGRPEFYSSLSNCFVLGQPFDSYSGIGQKSDEMVQVMKRRGGAGIDLSTIRPKNAVVHNQSGYSSGPVLFANRYSNNTLEVAQYGRRGALMLSINIKHLDSMEFAKEKQDETKLTGANVSIIIGDEFMQAVVDNRPFIQRFPCNIPIENFKVDETELEFDTTVNCNYFDAEKGVMKSGMVKKINAKAAWKNIIKYAHWRAEPGLMFEDNWYKYGTDGVYPQYRAVTSNPCSEIAMQPYDSCRLIALNLVNFVINPFTGNAEIDKQKLYEYFYEQLTICDIMVDLELKYIDNIIAKISASKDPQELKDSEINLWKKIRNEGQKGRRCGCGFTGLGDMLASLLVPYNASKETTEILNEVFAIKLKAELDAGVDMSILYGSFDGFDFTKEYDFYHDDTMNDEDFTLTGKNTFFQRLLDIDYTGVVRMMKYGRRNVSWSTAAPTGSLSILAQTTSGIEPLFLPFYMRRKKCIDASERVDYIDPADGQKFTMFAVIHYPFKLWIEQHSALKGIPDASVLSEKELTELFKTSPWYGSCANDIHWRDRIKVQSIVQRYTTHSISSTINLPKDVDVDTVENIYMESWKAGLKGNTVYRDGCRGGVLVSQTTEEAEEFSETKAPKRPIILPAVYHTIRANKKIYSVIIGFYEGKPYEVFVVSGIDNLPENLDDAKDSINGFLVKEGKDWYNFESETFVLREIPDAEADEKLVSLMISMALRHRTPLKFVIKTLDKTKPIAGSFTHKLIKILSKYVPDGESSGVKCPECGDELRFEGGCTLCPSCGWSKC